MDGPALYKIGELYYIEDKKRLVRIVGDKTPLGKYPMNIISISSNELRYDTEYPAIIGFNKKDLVSKTDSDKWNQYYRLKQEIINHNFVEAQEKFNQQVSTYERELEETVNEWNRYCSRV